MMLKQVPAYEFVILKHQLANSMYFVMEGRAEVLLKLGEDPVHVFNTGDFFGEVCFPLFIDSSCVIFIFRHI